MSTDAVARPFWFSIVSLVILLPSYYFLTFGQWIFLYLFLGIVEGYLVSLLTADMNYKSSKEEFGVVLADGKLRILKWHKFLPFWLAMSVVSIPVMLVLIFLVIVDI